MNGLMLRGALVCLCTGMALGQTPAKIRVLILTGANNHDWQATTPVIKAAFEGSPRFAPPEVIEDPSKCDAATFARFDTVVCNWSAFPAMTGRQWGPAAEQAFVQAIQSGKGFVAIHAASATSQDWPEYQQLIGLTWKLDHTAHGAYTCFQVTLDKPQHPILHGLSDFWTVDELWHNLVPMGAAQPQVLASAFSQRDWAGTGKSEPVLLETRLGQGRGINIILGHDAHALQNPAIKTILLRAAEYSATGRVSLPAPADWPTTPAAARLTGVDLDGLPAAAAQWKQAADPTARILLEQYITVLESRGQLDELKRLADRLAGLLAGPSAAEAKAFLCRQLGRIGDPDHLPALAGQLGVDGVAPEARWAISRIAGPSASRALLEALPKAAGLQKVGLINSLGELREEQATDALMAALGEKDQEVAAAAAAALGRIATPRAAEILLRRLDSAAGPLHAAIADACLYAAPELPNAGADGTSGQIYTRLMRASEPAAVQAAAMRGLLDLDKQAGQQRWAAFLTSPDYALFEAALTAIRQNPEHTPSDLIAQKVGGALIERAALVMEAVGERNDDVARRLSLEAAARGEEVLALAGLRAMARQGGAEFVLPLAQAAAGQGARAAVAAQSLAALSGTGVQEELSRLLDSGPAELRPVVLAAVAARRMPGASKLILKLATTEQHSQVWSLLGKLAEADDLPEMIAALPQVPDGARPAAEAAVLEAFGRALAAETLPVGKARELLDATTKSLRLHESVEIARALRVRIDKPTNLALSAKASSPDGLESDGAASGDAAANDGKPETYWDEVDNQKLYRLVLTWAAPVEASAINIKGHAYQSHCPKDFDILCDGRVVQSVKNAQYTPGTVEFFASFPGTRFTTLELAITGWYAASPAIRELEVYHIESPATAPSAAGTPGTRPAAGTPGTRPADAGPKLEWQRTDTSLALLAGSNVVWELNYPRGVKPYFHPVGLPDGTCLTALSPPDHVWHKALWLAWKDLNEKDYWVDDGPGKTEVISVQAAPADDHSAVIRMELRYHPLDQATIMSEQRTLTISEPTPQGGYAIDWESVFTAAGQDVHMKGGTAGGGYAGLSVRMAQDTRDWLLIDSEGRKDVAGGATTQNTHGQKARWMDFSLVNALSGREAGIAILEHPDTFRHPNQWHCIMDPSHQFGYFSPAPLWSQPYVLPANTSMKLRYRILIHPGRGDRAGLEQAWATWAAK